MRRENEREKEGWGRKRREEEGEQRGRTGEARMVDPYFKGEMNFGKRAS